MKPFGITVLAATAVMAIGIAATGCDRPCRPSPEKKADWMAKKIASKLDLNDAQKAKLSRIKEEVLARMKNESAGREKTGREAIALVKSDRLDAAAVNRIFDEREAAMKRLKPFIVEKIVEFHAMLTPEQRAKLADYMEKHHRRWKDNK